MAGKEKEKDPIVDSSMSWLLSVFSLLLVLTTLWAIWDEVIGLRPWKGYQKRFVKLYSDHLDTVEPDFEETELEIRESDEYQQLTSELEAAEESCLAEAAEIDETLNQDINPQISAISVALQKVRGKVNSMIYQVEVAPEETKDSLRTALNDFKAGPFEVVLETREGSETVSFEFDELVDRFNELKTERGRMVQARALVTQPADKIRARREAYLSKQLPSLSMEQLAGLRRKIDGFKVDIKQIHVADVDLVDRCESCHLGIREPLPLTADDMGGEGAFTSHPHPELLRIHNPEEFGCSPCHGGNGVATTSVKKAHGNYKHWLWPLFEPDNTEAGCLQCHEGTRHVEGAPILNQGLELFQNLGCWGCHRREGFNTEVADLQGVDQAMGALDRKVTEVEKKIDAAKAIAKDRDSTDEEVVEALASKNTLTLELSALATEREQLTGTKKSLLKQRKRPGPNLKEVKAKLNPEWIPVWLAATHDFRPGTKMPQFRFSGDQLKAVSAYVWQTAIDRKAPAQPQGDATRGKELFESRGCLACHSMGEDDDQMGAEFAANLSRVGEKLNYDYLVRWIHNPRERLAPYSPALGRDLTEEDYSSKGLPFEFDDEHPLCPITGDELVHQNMTVMPSLRLSWEESRDIASYLMTMKRSGANYPPADYLNDTSLLEEGRGYVRHLGCAGCHEMTGFENEGSIGTELTVEGSKPLERLDFGHATHDAKVEGWYDHKGFFERKLGIHTDDPNDPRNVTHRPNYFDIDKEKPNALDRLRMPDFYLDEEKNQALVTFLLGSADSRFPDRFYANPEGMAKDVSDGWEVLKKYNCMGCHQVLPNSLPMIQDLPIYRGDQVVKAPPSLVGEGFRVDPDWLADFLADPALGAADPHRNGIRPYLGIRMPTFYLSEIEIAKLVRFFAAKAKQASPYIPETVTPLTEEELEMARDAFQSSDCLKCHAGGDPSTFTDQIIAPNFVYTKERLKPAWVRRWMVDPAQLMPGTQMPTGLFDYKADEGRWVIKGAPPESMRDYPGDHVDLFVRYMWQFDSREGTLLNSR